MKFMRKNGGFTLVELIVVIAILAILAGVAVPAYSGYIAKAEEAADQQLLGAVNTAFAAACIATDGTMDDVNSASLSWNGQCIVGVASVNGSANADCDTNFRLMYGGNENTAFKVITTLVFDSNRKVFVDPRSVDSLTVSYKGSNVTISSEALMNLKDSSYGSIGGVGLLNQIDAVSDIAKGMANGTLSGVFDSADFQQAAMESLGVTDPTAFAEKYQGMIAKMADEQGISTEEAKAKIDANAAVLYAANNASQYTEEQINNLFANGSATADAILLNLAAGGNTAAGMADTALVYGMYTAYANSEKYGNDTLKGSVNDAGAVLEALQTDTDFLAYANSAEGKKDMAAYMDSLGVIVNTAGSDPAVVEDLMVNGYNNTELKGIIGGIMG